MISWIVASHREDILSNNLWPSLHSIDGDEILVVKEAPSITQAYQWGQAQAKYDIKVYVHSDVVILDLPKLRDALIRDTENTGIVGIIGSIDPCVPWWNGRLLGSVQDSRLGVLDYGPGGECAVVDGLLLASRRFIHWDISWDGWHGYDMDACAQMRAAQLPVWCIDDGKSMVRHNSDSPFALNAIDGWEEAVARYHEKWLF